MPIHVSSRNRVVDLRKNSGVKQINDNFDALWTGMNHASSYDELPDKVQNTEFGVVANPPVQGNQSVVATLPNGVKMLSAYFDIPYIAGTPGTGGSGSTGVESAVAWALAIAADSSHGYDQTSRWGPNYDCSSFVITAYEQAGIPLKTKGATYTGNLKAAALAAGFVTVAWGNNPANLQRGDIILKASSHVIMCIGSGQCVWASINEKGTATGGQSGDQTGNEIKTGAYYVYSGGWDCVLRYAGDVTAGTTPSSGGTWVGGNKYLSSAEMAINAQYILNYLTSAGWTKNAACGILGNMQSESTINPQIWQSLKSGSTSLGYGLVQWSPMTKLMDWCGSVGKNYTNMDAQLDMILHEVATNTQWIKSGMTFSQFTKSTDSAYNLAMIFISAYERPANPNQPARGTQAQHWFDTLAAGSGGGGGGTGGTGGHGATVRYEYPIGLFKGTTTAPIAGLFLPYDDWESYGVCPVSIIDWDLNGVTIKSEMPAAGPALPIMVTMMVIGN